MGKKEDTHERIVECGARMLRKDGYDGVSVADIMREAGLTHGGFYAHFESRDALVVEAMEHAAAESKARLDSAEDLETLASRYLADAHVKKPEAGCALAALATETRRQPSAVRGIATRNVESMIAQVRGLEPTLTEDDARVIVSALVGALILGRAVDKATLSKQLREAVTRFAKRS